MNKEIKELEKVLEISNGLIPVSVFFLFVFWITRIRSITYAALNLFILGCVSIAGYLGGKLVFH